MGGASDGAVTGYIAEETLGTAKYFAPLAQSVGQGQTVKATQSAGTVDSSPNVASNVYDHSSFTKLHSGKRADAKQMGIRSIVESNEDEPLVESTEGIVSIVYDHSTFTSVHPERRVDGLVQDTLDLVNPTQYDNEYIDQVASVPSNILDVFGTHVENKKRVENPISGITQSLADLVTSKGEDFSTEAIDAATPYFNAVEKPIHSAYNKAEKEAVKTGNAIINAAVDNLITTKTYNTEEQRRAEKSLIKIDNADLKSATKLVGKVTSPLGKGLDQPIAPKVRDTTLPPIEILPGAGPVSSKILKDIQKESANTIVKVIKEQPVFRRSSNLVEYGRMSRQKRAISK